MSDLKGKKLLVLGGTYFNCEIIRMAKSMGLYTVVTDYNPPEKSPGKLIADENYMVSTTDVPGVIRLMKEREIDGVLTGFSDAALPFYADICKGAGVPCYATKELFELYINKDRYKKELRKYGIPTVAEYDLNWENIEEKVKTVRFPVLVKPADNSGARGISICHTPDQLLAAYQEAYSKSKSGTALVEQYLTGPEVTVFWLFIDGEYYVTALGNRHVKQNQEGVIPLPVGYTFPSVATASYLKNIAPKAKRMFREQGIRDGMMFMQCKMENGECVVYDIGYRLTGSLEYKLFHALQDFDPMEMMIRYALTGKMTERPIKADPMFPGVYPYNISCLSAPGHISEIRGLDEVKNYPGVIDVYVSHFPGEDIPQSMKGLLAQITVRVLGSVDAKEKVIPTMQALENKIEIISDSGKNLRLPGIEASDIDYVI